MSRDFTLQPWMWWALLLALIYALIQFAEWYVDRLAAKTVEPEEVSYAQHVTANVREHQPDTSDYDECMADQREELAEEIQAWLRAREKYEGWLGGA